MKKYIVGTQLKLLSGALLMSTTIYVFRRNKKKYHSFHFKNVPYLDAIHVLI